MSKTCISCGATHALSYFNKDKTRQDGHDPRCKDCTRAACRAVYAAKTEKHLALKCAWKTANRDRHREWNRDYQKANPEASRQRTRDYVARRKQATPPWANRASLRQFFKDCPKGWHVDHIHPLKGKDFSELNVIWNLQYLPADQHYAKGNRLQAGGGV